MPLPEQPDPHPPTAPGRGTPILVAVALVLYAVLSHYVNSNPGARGLGAALSVGPVALLAGFLAWRLAPRLLAGSIIVGMAGLLVVAWPALERHYEWADLAQQGGVYALLAAAFGASLLPGRVPLCTQLDIRLHGALTVEETNYTRRATAAWGFFYALLGAAVVVLYFLAPLRVWSIFVNFVAFALIAAMGAADYGLRRRLLPRRAGASLAATLRQVLIG